MVETAGRRAPGAPRTPRRHLGMLLLVAALPAGAQEAPPPPPSAGEILARHLEARGGAERWREVEALRITGTYTAFSEDSPFTLLRRRPGLFRFDYRMLDTEVTEVWDGDGGWLVNGLEGFDWPVRMNRAQSALAAADADFDSPLMEAREKGHTVELAGRADFDGIDTWELRVTLAGGGEETWYLDAESYLAVGRVAPAVDFGSAVGTQKMFFDDHREVSGLRFPFYMETEYFIRHRIWAVDAIEINPELPEEVFHRPAPEGMAPLAGLAGTWEVKVESRPLPRAPWSEAPAATSATTLDLGGSLLEERLAVEIQGRPVEALRTLSYDRFGEVYRLTHTDDLTGHTEVFEGIFDEDGRLVLSNLETGTARQIDGQTVHGRDVLYDLGPDGFKVDREMSTDDGETWFANLRLTYARSRP